MPYRMRKCGPLARCRSYNGPMTGSDRSKQVEVAPQRYGDEDVEHLRRLLSIVDLFLVVVGLLLAATGAHAGGLAVAAIGATAWLTVRLVARTPPAG